MMNRINLDRYIRSACRVIRESRYKGRTKEAWKATRDRRIKIITTPSTSMRTPPLVL
jgi:hypothetical protein